MLGRCFSHFFFDKCLACSVNLKPVNMKSPGGDSLTALSVEVRRLSFPLAHLVYALINTLQSFLLAATELLPLCHLGQLFVRRFLVFKTTYWKLGGRFETRLKVPLASFSKLAR